MKRWLAPAAGDGYVRHLVKRVAQTEGAERRQKRQLTQSFAILDVPCCWWMVMSGRSFLRVGGGPVPLI